MRTAFDFEDIALKGDKSLPLDEYRGLSWSGFYGYNPDPADLPKHGQGYLNGLTSGEQEVFIAPGGHITVPEGTFDFKSANITAAFRKIETLTVVGYLDGEERYRVSIEITKKAPTFATFDFKGVDYVSFLAPSHVVFDAMVFGKIRGPSHIPAFAQTDASTMTDAIGLHGHAHLWPMATHALA